MRKVPASGANLNRCGGRGRGSYKKLYYSPLSAPCTPLRIDLLERRRGRRRQGAGGWEPPKKAVTQECGAVVWLGVVDSEIAEKIY